MKSNVISKFISLKDRVKEKTDLNFEKGLLTKYISKPIVKLLNNLNSNVKEEYKQLNLYKTQWYTKKQIDELQNKLLRHLIHHAYTNTRFYNRMFKKRGLKPEDIKTKEDLVKLPIINKEIVRQNYEEISYPPLREGCCSSGGSTGHPFHYHGTYYWNLVRMSCNWRFWEWANYTNKSRLASFFSRTLGKQTPNDLIIEGQFEHHLINDVIHKIKEFKPEIIRVYPFSAYLVAKYLLSQDESIKVKSLITSGETLFDFQREVIEEAFQCELFDEYGCNDGGLKAFECTEHFGMHHAVERSILEIIDGKIVSTDLWNYALPFIRYENHDIGEILDTECPCGKKLPLLKVEGRNNDFIVTPYSIIFPLADVAEFYRVKGIDQYQFVQKSSDLIEVKIVKNDGFKEEEFEKASSIVLKSIRGMKLKIRFVDKIPLTKMGKRRFIINEWKDMATIMEDYF